MSATTSTQDVDAITRARSQATATIPTLDSVLPDEGNQDWHLLITPGHVVGHRLLETGKRLFPLAIAATIAGAWLVGAAVVGNVAGLGGAPASITRALTADPAHYAALPGSDQRVDYRLAWLAGAAGSAQQGLSEQGWGNLVRAAAADVRAHGDDVTAYTELPKLDPAATITRPDRVFGDHRADLASGIVALPKGDPNTTAIVAAWVQGKLVAGAMQVRRVGQQVQGSCRAIIGEINGCAPPLPSDLTILQPEGK